MFSAQEIDPGKFTLIQGQGKKNPKNGPQIRNQRLQFSQETCFQIRKSTPESSLGEKLKEMG